MYVLETVSQTGILYFDKLVTSVSVSKVHRRFPCQERVPTLPPVLLDEVQTPTTTVV